MNPVNENKQILNIPIEDIIPNRFQPRLAFDENGLKELAASIKEHGIIQPLVLRRLGDKFEIIAGERRYKAAKLAGLMTVPAIISEMDDKKSAEVAIVENVQRRDLSSIEEAKSYKALLDKGYLTQDELAKKMGLSQAAISNKLRLLSLSPAVQDALINGKISERHARSLLTLDHSMQDEWLDTIIKERLTVKELDKRISGLKKKEDEEVIPVEEIIPNTNNEENNEKVPNTFFNFLEKESANMDLFEDNNNEKKNRFIIKEENEPEEVELLDFLAPSLEEVKDMSKANDLIDELIKSLNDNNYNVTLNKEEDGNSYKYSIVINKN